MNLTQVLLTALKDNGAREIFGLPGDFALAFFNIAEDSAILPFYMLSHEPSLGFAADAAARMNLGLGVAAVTYGVGGFNLVNSIACAYAEKSPVVVISGAPGTTRSCVSCGTIFLSAVLHLSVPSLVLMANTSSQEVAYKVPSEPSWGVA